MNLMHPLVHQLNLAVWPVSGIPSTVKEQRQVFSWQKATEAANFYNGSVGSLIPNS